MMFSLGCRVIRGPDWHYGDTDGGKGYLGTITSINDTNSRVSVQWDMGQSGEYRGSSSNHDLCIYHNPQTDKRHNGVLCDGCNQDNIVGIRWKCIDCDNYDLCTACYHGGIHEKNHEFRRIMTSSNKEGLVMSPRSSVTKIGTLIGMFRDAVVCRGRNWDYKDQDGGSGKTGKIIAIRSWNSDNSVKGFDNCARVKWGNGNVNNYRLGFEGKVDLKCLEEACGGSYYPNHLPLLEFKHNASINDKPPLRKKKSNLSDGSEPTTTSSSTPTRPKRDVCLKPEETGAAGGSSSSYHLFLSYEWGIQEKVRMFYSILTQKGFNCWMDVECLHPGDNKDAGIHSGIAASKVVISFVTKAYAKSVSCNKEIALADVLVKPIIPLVMEQGAWPVDGAAGLVLTPVVYIDMSTEDLRHMNIDKLVKSLRDLIEGFGFKRPVSALARAVRKTRLMRPKLAEDPVKEEEEEDEDDLIDDDDGADSSSSDEDELLHSIKGGSHSEALLKALVKAMQAMYSDGKE